MEYQRKLHGDEAREINRNKDGSGKLQKCMKAARKIKDELSQFVSMHVTALLVALYKNIEEAETVAIERNHQSSSGFKDAINWFYNLYLNSDSKPRAVGPVGERPIHVCFLSAYRFEAVDFEKAGNYMRSGIIDGIKKFVEDPNGKEELFAQYGKDYCAAAGNFLQKWKEKCGSDMKRSCAMHWSMDPPSSFLRSFETDSDPPFWAELKRWHRKHYNYQASQEKSNHRADLMSTRGIYEDESIIFPVIAAGDEKMIRWLAKEMNHGNAIRDGGTNHSNQTNCSLGRLK